MYRVPIMLFWLAYKQFATADYTLFSINLYVYIYIYITTQYNAVELIFILIFWHILWLHNVDTYNKKIWCTTAVPIYEKAYHYIMLHMELQ